MAALVLVAAGVWIVAAALLWRSSVPGGLRLPAVDLHAVFSDAELSRAARFERFERVLWVLSQVALLGVLAAYAARGARFARESAAGPIGTGMLLGMLGFALVWVVQVPFQLASLWWERRYDISQAGYLDVLIGGWFALGATFLFLCLALLIVMALARVMGDRWWLLGGPAFVGLAALFLLVSPYLLPNTHRLDDPALLADARAYERAEGVGPIRIDVQEVSELTKAANAMALGIGPTRRIVLWDTLLEFPRAEASFVLAHEIAHHSRDHLPKGLAWYALFALPGAWAIARTTRRRGGMRDPLAVPLSLLVLVVLQLAALPFENMIGRRIEAEADWVALERARNPAAARGAFRHFTVDSLSDPSPPGWAYVLLEGHPTIEQRLAMIQAWEVRQATSAAQSPPPVPGRRALAGRSPATPASRR